MRFGVRPVEGGAEFEPTVRQAELAEQLGFDSVYLAEHHGLTASPYWPSPLLGLAAIAARTSRIDLGTNIALLPLYNPVRLAGEIAYLDVMSQGRTRFGFGLGWRPEEFEALGVPKRERGRRMDEYLELLHRLLTERSVTFDGDFYSFENFELTPKPVQSPRPEFFVGGWSSQAMRRATTYGDGWMAPGGTYEQLTEFVSDLRERDDAHVVVSTEGTVVRESAERAERASREFVKNRRIPYIRSRRSHHYADFKEQLDAQGVSYDLDSTTGIERFARKLARHELEDGLESYTRETCFVGGTPDECIEQIERIEALLSCEEIIFRPYSHGYPTSDALETIEMLGEEVLPSF